MPTVGNHPHHVRAIPHTARLPGGRPQAGGLPLARRAPECDGPGVPARVDLTHPELAHLVRWVQDGVVSRRQVLAVGGTDHDIARMVRRRELTTVHPGVYVDHSGPLTRRQRAWVAVLAAWPAALCHESALPDPPPRPVHVAVARERTVTVPGWVVAHRMADLDARTRWNATPPTVGLEHSWIDLAARHLGADDVGAAFASLARLCFSRRTTPDRIADVLATRARVAGRATIEGLLADARDGACSVLERGYLLRVERAHGLPRGRRQARSDATGRRTDQDVSYDDFGFVVELDGRAFHDSPEARDADAERDLAELASRDAATARVTYGLVFGGPCATAARIGAVLRRRGWTGELRPCPSCPRLSHAA